MALLKENAYERLASAREAGRLAHAYLITGPSGSGKEWLAQRMAALVLETHPDSVAAHPDFHTVGPESKSRRIVIGQMRTMDQALQMKPMRGRTKVAIVHDADRLQPQAANAFLKTLEEPPQGCHLFLLTALRNAIMDTIISRCIAVPLRTDQARALSQGQQAVVEALTRSLLQSGGPDVAAAMRFTRVFQKTTAAIRTEVTATLENELKQQLKHYRDSADADWEESREDQIKAQAEAAVILERANLLQAAGEVLAAALRAHHVADPDCPDSVARIAQCNPPAQLLRRLDALDRVRDLLARGVQEPLALEAGFIEMISAKHS